MEIFQFFIIQDPSFAMRHTDELIFYDNELDLYILGVTYLEPRGIMYQPRIFFRASDTFPSMLKIEKGQALS